MTTMPFLLDADWAIDALKGRRGAASTLRRLAPEGILVSLITIGELYEGTLLLPDPDSQISEIRSFLAAFPALGLSESIAEQFARIRSRMRQRGEIIPDLDILLGATALEYDLIVLTRNLRHLQRIPGLRIIGQD